MSKYYKYFYLGSEVKPDSVITVGYRTPFGDTTIDVTIKDENTIINFIQEGVPIEKIFLPEPKLEKPKQEIVRGTTRLGNMIEERMKSIPNNLNHYLDISNNPDLSVVTNWMLAVAPLELYRLYTKFIAYELDKAYHNNIRCCKEVYFIDDMGKPYKIYKKNFNNKEWNDIVNNFPLFRNEVDVIVCQKLLKPLKKHVWSGEPREYGNSGECK